MIDMEMKVKVTRFTNVDNQLLCSLVHYAQVCIDTILKNRVKQAVKYSASLKEVRQTKIQGRPMSLRKKIQTIYIKGRVWEQSPS